MAEQVLRSADGTAAAGKIHGDAGKHQGVGQCVQEVGRNGVVLGLHQRVQGGFGHHIGVAVHHFLAPGDGQIPVLQCQIIGDGIADACFNQRRGAGGDQFRIQNQHRGHGTAKALGLIVFPFENGDGRGDAVVGHSGGDGHKGLFGDECGVFAHVQHPAAAHTDDTFHIGSNDTLRHGHGVADGVVLDGVHFDLTYRFDLGADDMSVELIHNRVGNVQDLSMDVRLTEGGTHFQNFLLPDFQHIILHIFPPGEGFGNSMGKLYHATDKSARVKKRH